jgi:flagellar motility protein MotE (MotC chaperone)
MIPGIRLVDGVIIAAVALLALKGLGLFAGSHRTDQPSSTPIVKGTADLPKFARVLAHARTNSNGDIAVTGALDDSGQNDGTDAKRDKAPAVGSQGSSPSQRAILERLGERREELQQRGREIEMRERLLENAEKKLEIRVNELKELEDKAESAASKRSDTEAGALRNLVVMYEAMKPKDAAKVFDRLPHEVLVPVVLQMKPVKMAEVLAVMAPEAAEKLTVALATRAKRLSADARVPSPGPGLAPNELPSIEGPAFQPRR